MFKPDSLLLYKNRPARLLEAGDRLEIELPGGETARVRPKDVTLLHAGPLSSLRELRPQTGELQAAWEILAGGQTDLPELAELIYGKFTPATAWAAWQLVAEGAYFEGEPGRIRARSAEEVARRKLERDLAEAQQRAWQGFLSRAQRGELIPADREFLKETEALALGRGQRSAVLRALSRTETPDQAYALLLELGAWDELVNPYPQRLGMALSLPDLPAPELPDEPRLDLSALTAFAIDDETTDTPDDALSWEALPDGDRLWVHVADVAALITPGSPLDEEARARGESLHLPEGTVHLVPRAVTNQLGLGLNALAPALSFGIDLDAAGKVTGFQVAPSTVRVTRLTYLEAEQLLESPPFAQMEARLELVREHRREAGAVMIDFPEANILVNDGQVQIIPLPPLRSRALVQEAMILAGVETARFAAERGLRLAFSQQEPPESASDSGDRPSTLAGMFALRRTMKRSRFRTTPAPHSGLGVEAYTQVTSPLRRYLDLVNHQQIRAVLRGGEPLDESAMLERIGAVEAVLGASRQAEFLSEKHWTLVYLLQHPDWRGEGILVDRRGALGTIIIPALALETRVPLRSDLPLDSLVTLVLSGVDLAQREARFRIER